MKMKHITIHTDKLESSIEFYSQVLGLSVQMDMRKNGGMSIVFLSNEEGETAIELIEDKDASYAGHGISIGFSAENVDVKRRELESAGYSPSPMISPNPHVRFFFIEDPNGVKIQII